MQSKLHRSFTRGALACAAAAALTAGACGRSEQVPPPAAVSNPVDPATAGAITGLVKFEGTPPVAEPISMDSDPYCEKQPQNRTETVVVGQESGLQNVFVYVKDGLGDREFPVPSTAVVLDQKGCRYVPHVLGI